MTTPALPGSPFLSQIGSELFLEATPLQAIATDFGTPVFAYSKSAMLAALAAYQRAFVDRDALICYAMKANSSLAILQLFAKAGCGFDIVSGGELRRALVAGARPERIVFSGVGKTREEIRTALQAGVGCFNVESEAELTVLNDVAPFNAASARRSASASIPTLTQKPIPIFPPV
jgi:diaminopimelate decarboxylase